MTKFNLLLNSQDLNPIENLCKIVKIHVQNKYQSWKIGQLAITMQCDLEEVLKEVTNVLISTIKRLVIGVGKRKVLDDRLHTKTIQIGEYFMLFYVKILYTENRLSRLSTAFPILNFIKS